MVMAPENKNRIPDIYPQCIKCHNITKIYPQGKFEEIAGYFKFNPKRSRIACEPDYLIPETGERSVPLHRIITIQEVSDGKLIAEVGNNHITCPAETSEG